MSKETTYINNFKKLALDTGLAFGIPPSIVLAQSILESGWNTSTLSKDYNNFFGIKCHGYHNCITIAGTSWRRYLNPIYSFHDYGLFLTSQPRYNDCFNYTNYKDWANCLMIKGYAGSSTTYANKLIKIIEDYNLETLDNKAQQQIKLGRFKPYLFILLLTGLALTLARSRNNKK